jgi:hypothetical protein
LLVVKQGNGVFLLPPDAKQVREVALLGSSGTLDNLAVCARAAGIEIQDTFEIADPFPSARRLLAVAKRFPIWFVADDFPWIRTFWRAAGDLAEPLLAAANVVQKIDNIERRRDPAIAAIVGGYEVAAGSVPKPELARDLENLLRLFSFARHPLSETDSCLDTLSALAPYFAGIAFAHLANGQLPRGWWLYEASKRRELRDGKKPFSQPLWAGEPPSGESILVWRNAGPGDEIVYAQVFNDVIAAGAKLFIEVDERLVSLFRRSFPETTVVRRETPPSRRLQQSDIRFQATFASPCRYFRRSLEDFSPQAPYLIPDPERVSHWKQWLSETFGQQPVIGISWRSGSIANKRFNHDLLAWKELLQRRDFAFVSVQYGDCREELDALRAATGISIPEPPDLDLFNDFENLAALLSAFDATVSIDNVTSNLAGAVGATVIQLTKRFGHLTLGQERSLWYPAMSFVFPDERQHDECISEVITKLESELIMSPGTEKHR